MLKYILDARCARGTTKKAHLAVGFIRKTSPGRLVFLFINLSTAGDDMQEYSNVSTQKQRVLYA
jgi:hypothetical protein